MKILTIVSPVSSCDYAKSRFVRPTPPERGLRPQSPLGRGVRRTGWVEPSHRYQSKLFLYALLTLCLGMGSCKETCGIIAEPTLSLNFINMATPNFKNIRIVGATKDLPNSGTATPSLSGQYGNIILPINLNSNNTTYIFEQPNKTDTLTVYYQVVVKEISLTCGNILDIDSTAIKPKSTFKKVTTQFGTYYRIRNWGSSGNGLTVNVSEL